MVGRTSEFGHPLAAPGPDRRTDKVDGLDAGFAQPLLEAEIEVGRVDADEDRGPVTQQAITQLTADSQQLRQAPDRVDIAEHRETLMRPPGVQPLSDELGATNAEGLQIGPTGFQALQQQTTEEVARSFTCDQRQPQRA